jgi:hypothetical protein
MTFKPQISQIIIPFTFLSIGILGLLSSAFGDAPYATWSAVTAPLAAYGNGIDTVSFRNNAIYTVGNYQFVAYYNNDSTPHVTLARRDINTNTWTNISTSYTADTVTDDHDVISFGIDGDGIMHMSWGMHNGSTFHYAKTSASVLGSTFSPSFATSTINGVGSSTTYPEFYNLSDGDLMFVYRTGSSGSGNTLFSRFDTATHTWSASPTTLTNGPIGSYTFTMDGGTTYHTETDRNAYTNNLVFDSQGRIQMSWVWRETSDFLSNHDIMYAYATNENATTWQKMGGASQTVPITLNNASIIKSVPTGSSLINQTSMTVDANDNPIIATYWAPGGDTNPNAARQYMLEWYNGTSWQTSQISNRTVSDTKITNNDALRIREVGRPIVLVDADGRVVVITRSNDQNNVVTAYYSTNKTSWTLLNLTTANSGRYEPIYDEVRWKNNNILDLFYEPAFANSDGTRTMPPGQTQYGAQVSVLEWNELRYLRGIITVDWTGGNGSGTTNWGLTANWTNNALPPDGKWTSVSFGNESSANHVVDMLSAGRTVGNITFTAGTSTTIQSTGGYSLTLDNSGSSSTISVAGTHTISAPVLMDNDVNVSGTGTLNLSGGISGSYALDVLSGNVSAKSISISTLTLGSGATLTIQAIPGGPHGGDITPVPEPSTIVLFGIGALGLMAYAWRRWKRGM